MVGGVKSGQKIVAPNIFNKSKFFALSVQRLFISRVLRQNSALCQVSILSSPLFIRFKKIPSTIQAATVFGDWMVCTVSGCL
jgi:hypothetical protein